jgi:hypothetical protein
VTRFWSTPLDPSGPAWQGGFVVSQLPARPMPREMPKDSAASILRNC